MHKPEAAQYSRRELEAVGTTVCFGLLVHAEHAQCHLQRGQDEYQNAEKRMRMGCARRAHDGKGDADEGDGAGGTDGHEANVDVEPALANLDLAQQSCARVQSVSCLLEFSR